MKVTPKYVYETVLHHAPRILRRWPSMSEQDIARWATSITTVESTFETTAKNPNSTARGLMQITVDAQTDAEKWLKGQPEGLPYNPGQFDSLFDPEYNLLLGTTYFSYQIQRYKSLDKGIHAYNQGSYPGVHPRDGEEYRQKVIAAYNELDWEAIEGTPIVAALPPWFEDWLPFSGEWGGLRRYPEFI